MMKENFATVFDRQPLFPGNSCFPLSPGALKNNEAGVGDQGDEGGDEQQND